MTTQLKLDYESFDDLALARLIAARDEYREKLMRGSTSGLSPEGSLAREQLRRLIEQAIGRLPDAFRLVFVLREIEGLSVAEASDVLGVAQATVKTRLLRAKRRLQDDLAPEVKSALDGVFPFAGADCAAITERVLGAFCKGGWPLAGNLQRGMASNWSKSPPGPRRLA